MRRHDPLPRLVTLALAAWALMGPGALPAQGADSPAEAVGAALDAVAAGESGSLDPVVCARRRGGADAVIDLARAFGGGVMDAGPLVEGATITLVDRSLTVLAASADVASVGIEASLRISPDPDAARAWVREGLRAAGQPAPDAVVDRYLSDLRTILDGGVTITGTVEVVRENGAWLLCDSIRTEDALDPGASPAPATHPLCDVMRVEELNAATGFAFETATPFHDGCQWDAAVGAGYHTLTVRREAGDLAQIREVWMRGRDLTVDGRPAWATSNGTWVDLGDSLLAILPNLDGAIVTEPVDAIEFARTVADLVVPRLP